MKEETRTFSPKGYSPEEYITKYPELKDYDETNKLKSVELIWCWYYGSNDSPFVKANIGHEDKCEKITILVFDKMNEGRYYDDGSKKKLLSGNIPAAWVRAIDFFRKVDTDTRAYAKNMIDTIFEQYNDIISKGVDAFKNDIGEVDYAKYVGTMKKIQDELPSLIKQKERGFGVSDVFVGNDGTAEGDYYVELFLRSK